MILLPLPESATPQRFPRAHAAAIQKKMPLRTGIFEQHGACGTTVALWNTVFFPAYRQGSGFLHFAGPISREQNRRAGRSNDAPNPGIRQQRFLG
jgi:hypothetical protein